MILERIDAALKLLEQLGYTWDDDQRAWLDANGMLALDSDAEYLSVIASANGVQMPTSEVQS